MRVIGGKYKKRLLKNSVPKNVRPTTNRVKEAVFSIIGEDIENSVFLDLFSGSGGMGIEALSRGARKVYFNDLSKYSIKTIYNNLYQLKCINYKIYNYDYKKVLEKINEKVDIVYIDAPFVDFDINEAVNIVLNSDVFNKDSLLIVETNKNLELNDSLEYKEYKYSKIYIYKIKVN